MTDDVINDGIEDDDSGGATDEVIRRENFDAAGPLDIDVALGAGRVTIALAEEPGAGVEVRYDPTATNVWLQGLSSVLNWFGGQFGEELETAKVSAVRDTRVEMVNDRLIVHTPKRNHMVPL